MTSTTRAQAVKKISDCLALDDVLDDLLTDLGDTLVPEDIFSEDKLVAWAESNGFVHKDDQ